MVLLPPLGNGDPGTGVRLPSAAISKASTGSIPRWKQNAVVGASTIHGYGRAVGEEWRTKDRRQRAAGAD